MVRSPADPDDVGMEETTTAEDEGRKAEQAVLRRPFEGRSVAGVAAAIAHYFNIPVGLVRAGFVISLFFGGAGLAAYAAGWVAIREEGENESLVEHWLANASKPSSWVGLGLVALGVVIVLGSVSAFSGSTFFAAVLVLLGILLYRGVFDDGLPRFTIDTRTSPTTVRRGTVGTPAPADDEDEPANEDEPVSDIDAAHAELDDEIPLPPPTPGTAVVTPAPTPRQPRSPLGRFTFAALLIVLGTMAVIDTADLASFSMVEYLAVGTIIVGTGLLVGAFFGRAYSLIVVGFVFVGALQMAIWFDVPLSGGFGDPSFAPQTVDELLIEDYDLLAGQLDIDLSNISSTGTIVTDMSLGAGELNLTIPNDMRVVVDMRVVAGEIKTPVEDTAGTDQSWTFTYSPDDPVGTLEIDASVGFGELDVRVEQP